jgi:hypothetical protein
MSKVKIFQGGTDGFGHQLEGTIRLLSLSIHKKADYQYNYKKNYSFEHSNLDIDLLTNYINEALSIIKKKTDSDDSSSNISEYTQLCNDYRSFEEIMTNDHDYTKNLYFFDGVGCGRSLPNNFEPIEEVETALPIIRDAFVHNNKYLPHPSYKNQFINVCCHIRLGDAVGQRPLDNEKIYNVIRYFQKWNYKYYLTIHSDGDISHLDHPNTYLKEKTTDVLQILSDFIYADILIINYSALSISAHLLADKKQIVIRPDNVGVTFNDRVLKKCISCKYFTSGEEIK